MNNSVDCSGLNGDGPTAANNGERWWDCTHVHTFCRPLHPLPRGRACDLKEPRARSGL